MSPSSSSHRPAIECNSVISPRYRRHEISALPRGASLEMETHEVQVISRNIAIAHRHHHPRTCPTCSSDVNVQIYIHIYIYHIPNTSTDGKGRRSPARAPLSHVCGCCGTQDEDLAWKAAGRGEVWEGRGKRQGNSILSPANPPGEPTLFAASRK